MPVLLLALALLIGCGPKTPPPAAGSPATGNTALCRVEDWPEASRAIMVAAQQRGLTLAARDHLAWEASDRVSELVAANPPANPSALQSNGYLIAIPSATEAAVLFLRQDETSTTAVIKVHFDAAHPNGSAEILPNPEPMPADGPEAHAMRALRTSMADPRFIRKAATYNPDVLPWSDDPADGWAVYLVPGAQEMNAVPLGGGYRVHVGPEGRDIQEFLPLSQTVIPVDVAMLKNQKAGMVMTTVLTPYPDATYIAFANIWDVPVAVGTQTNGAWFISGSSLCWMDLAKK